MRRPALEHAIALLHLVVPALYVRTIIRDLHLQGVTEIGHSNSGDIGNREFVAGHEPVPCELLIELFMESGNAQLAAINQRRYLRHRLAMPWQSTVDEVGMRVPENFGVPDHALVIGSALPRADGGFLQSCGAIRGGCG